MTTTRTARTITILAIALLAIGCESIEVKDQRLKDKDAGFSATLPSKDWILQDADETSAGKRIVIANPKTNGTILVLLSEAPTTDLPLNVLGRKLFFGMTDRRLITREQRQVGGIPAAYVEMVGKEGEREVHVAAYAIKAGKQLYDVVYFASPSDFAAGAKDFHQLAKSLDFGKPKKR